MKSLGNIGLDALENIRKSWCRGQWAPVSRENWPPHASSHPSAHVCIHLGTACCLWTSSSLAHIFAWLTLPYSLGRTCSATYLMSLSLRRAHWDFCYECAVSPKGCMITCAPIRTPITPTAHTMPLGDSSSEAGTMLCSPLICSCLDQVPDTHY